MPVYRRKISCGGGSPASAAKKHRVIRRALTDEEREEAKIQKEIRKAKNEITKEWQETLPKAWTPPGGEPISLKAGTLAMYKSDAKAALKLTETEILTLAHEEIQCSPKTYFPLHEVRLLALRKVKANVMELPSGFINPVDLRVWTKWQHSGRRIRGNWRETSVFPMFPTMD